MPRGERKTALLVLALLAGALLITWILGAVVAEHRARTRGVGSGSGPAPRREANLFGANVYLDQERSREEQERVLRLTREAGLYWVRQRFAWKDIEPSPGEYSWEKWDAIVYLVGQYGLDLLAVLDTSPTWAHSRGPDTSPPDSPGAFADFAGRFAERYRGRILHYQLWDEPNIYPHWGERYASPREYLELLKLAYARVKAADGRNRVILAGLAPTVEHSEWNQSDVDYLAELYRLGGRNYFDIIAAKPYGFWTGPEDRRVDPRILNFSRAILLRETAVRNGDGQKPIWAVEFGWNALPAAWRGRPSPWGSDSEERQARRTALAMERARDEWTWLGAMMLPGLHLPGEPEDPRQGFGLVNGDFSPRPAYQAVQAVARATQEMAARPSGVSESQLPYYGALSLLAAALALLSWQLVRQGSRLPWARWSDWYVNLGQGWGTALLALAFLLFYGLPWPPLSLAALVWFGYLAYLRLDLALYLTIFSLPFYLYPKTYGSIALSIPEITVLSCSLLWLWRGRRTMVGRLRHPAAALRGLLSAMRPRAFPMLALAFLALGVLSLGVTSSLRLSLRELRVNVLEPVLLYFLMVSTWREERQVVSAVKALVAGGAVVATYGLYQWLFTGDVITAEGVRRMLATYRSPNNLGLYLERIIPWSLALAWSAGRWRKIYLGALGSLGLALFLTFSVGAWLGAAGGLFAVGLFLFKGRKALATVLILGLLAGGLALPIVRVERVISHLSFRQETTTFLRLQVWQASANMIRDHPLLGVGLDGFLEQYRTRYIRPEAWKEPNLSHPHNLILEFWVNLGVPGVVILVLFLWGFYRRASHVYHEVPPEGEGRAMLLGAMGAMTAAVVHGLVDRFYFGAPDLAYVFFVTLTVVELSSSRRAPETGPLI